MSEAEILAKLDEILDLLRDRDTPEGQTEDDDELVPSISSPPRAPSCTHQHQSIKGTQVVCAKCGFVLVASAGIGNHVAGSGTRESSR